MPSHSTEILQHQANRNALRKQMRELRRQQPASLILEKSAAICQCIIQTRLFQSSQHIALYFSQQGEVDLQPLLHSLWRTNKQVYLPVLHPFQHGKLHFRSVTAQTKLKPNKFNIPEPVQNSAMMAHPHTLDLVLMPLVAFDHYGNRIGMGGGFYDRTFWAHTQSRHWRRPILMGVAFDFQKTDRIYNEKWDVPLASIVTETGIIKTDN